MPERDADGAARVCELTYPPDLLATAQAALSELADIEMRYASYEHALPLLNPTLRETLSFELETRRKAERRPAEDQLRLVHRVMSDLILRDLRGEPDRAA